MKAGVKVGVVHDWLPLFSGGERVVSDAGTPERVTVS
jgi:hypothetical protein